MLYATPERSGRMSCNGNNGEIMKERERFIAALERRPLTGLVPHFELVFFLTMEAFGKLHPSQRQYAQWDQMSRKEQELHLDEIARLYIDTARRYQHSAIFYHGISGWNQETDRRCLERIRELGGDEYALVMHGDATYALPTGDEVLEFSCRMFEDAQGLKDQAERMVDDQIAQAEKIRSWGVLDGFALCSDYCFNTNPFMSPEQFGQFVFPYLRKLIAAYREMGFYTIKHTDGNIMPILDMLVEANPHALHSLDPQGGVDIAEVKRRYGDRVCLIGNVNCASLQTGTPEELADSVRYALRSGMPGYGYIFSTSNCVYTGLALDRYEMMLDIWRKEGVYQG